MKKSLYLDGEIARNENNNYLILAENGEYLKKVDKEIFLKELKTYKKAFFNSWDKNKKEEYINFIKEVL